MPLSDDEIMFMEASSDHPEEDWAEYAAYLDGELEAYELEKANAELAAIGAMCEDCCSFCEEYNWDYANCENCSH